MKRAIPLSLVALLLLGSGTGAGAYPRPGRTELVSVAFDGAAANEDSGTPSISDDGRCVAFGSYADNLVPGDTNGEWDLFVFMRDTHRMVRVSGDGTQGNATHSPRIEISGDCRFVAFESAASKLVQDDDNGMTDVFVRDLAAGTTVRASLSSGGVAADGPSAVGGISRDGRFVVFSSEADNLVPGDDNGTADVFLRDLWTGSTELVSVASDGTHGDGTSTRSKISANGRTIAFESEATNLVRGDTNAAMGLSPTDVFVRDRKLGNTERVSVASDGSEAMGSSRLSAVSANGGYVLFASSASNLVPNDTTSGPFNTDLFLRDRSSGLTERVSIRSDGGEAGATDGSISADGRLIAFVSEGFPGYASGAFDVFVHDRTTGATEHISDHRVGGGFDGLAMTPDGRAVAFSASPRGDFRLPDGIFVHQYGPPVGIGSVQASRSGETVTVSGDAMYAGADATSGGRIHYGEIDEQVVNALGADVIGGSLTYRPEQEDLLARWFLKSIPGARGALLTPGFAGDPAVVYVFGFRTDGTRYEVRASGRGYASSFARDRCAPACVLATPLGGGVGTTGNEVRVAVPLAALGAREGSPLTDVVVASGFGDISTGIIAQPLDASALHDSTIPARTLRFGIVPRGAAPVFDHDAEPGNGIFSLELPAPTAPGDYDVWARACIGTVCGDAAAPLLVS